MSFKKTLTVNPLTGTQTIYHENDEGVAIQTVKDETQIVEDNKAILNATSSLDRWGDGRMVLRGVPFDVIEEWKAKGWFTKENFHKCLADPRAPKYKVFGK